jgi:hypothetical protein
MKTFEVEIFVYGKRFTVLIEREHDYEAREAVLQTLDVGNATEINITTYYNKKYTFIY